MNAMIKMQKGFTLIEFLIVIGILALSVGSIMLVLTTVVKGVNQTNIQAEVKQNGQATLEALTLQIRNGSDVYGLPATLLFGAPKAKPTNAESAVWLFGPTGEKITIACVEGNGTTTNGYIGMYVDSSTALSPPLDLTSFKALSNTDPVSGVDIDCGPTAGADDGLRVTQAGNAKIVQIEFTANQGIQAPSRVDFKANALFRSSVSLRLYQ